MSLLKALITAELIESEINRLKEKMEVIYETWKESGQLYFDEEELIEKLKQIDIFICEGDNVKKRVIEESSLKIIASCRNDPNNVDLKTASEKKIPVIYTPKRNSDSVADLTLCLILTLARNLTRVDKYLHSEDFELIDLEDWVRDYKKFEGIELKGKTVGVIGFGNIGKLVAQRLIPFGVNLLITDPFVDKDKVKEFGTLVELEELMSKSDFITLHLPPIEETNNLINEKMISLMKPSSYLINTAKGSVLNYRALKKALEDKKIAGVALDVFPLEPIDEDNEFLKFENVIILPHYGGNTVNVIKRHSRMIVDDVLSILDKKPPKNIANPEVLERIGITYKEKQEDSYIPYHILRKKLADVGLQLLKEGFISGSSGNLSIRIPNEEKIVITPSNVKYEMINPNDILVLNFDGNVLIGDRNPSVEKIMHLTIYKNRPDVGAIIHSHGVYSTILSLLDLNLPPVVEEFVPYIGGEVKVADYGEAGSEEIAENAIKALGDLNAVILSNHGNICCGSHIEGALDVLKMLERTAKIYIFAKLLGTPKSLPEETVDYELDIFEIFKESKKI